MNRFAVVAGAACALPASAGVMNVDFSVDGAGAALVNAQEITGSEFSPLFTISSAGNNAGMAIFDSTPGGPNEDTGDNDLIVDLGNVLILQSDSGNEDDQTVAGIFDQPNDDQNGGTITFDFTDPLGLVSIDLIDIDDGNSAFVTLTDADGLVREFDVPNGWTNDIQADGPIGFGTIDFADLGPQTADDPAVSVTAAGDAGFDLSRVVRLEVVLSGSGGIDNLVIPAPGAMALLAAGLGIAARRRRG